MNIMEIIKITNGTLIRKSKEKEIKKIKIDSREIERGDAFLAISSGHNYIKEAIEKGASLIIVDREINIYKKVNIIKINNSIEALQSIASYIRKKYDPIVIAITGSAGKTTTKEMLYKVLSNKYNVLKNNGNENNHIGVPKTLLKIDENTDIVITEMGMNHEDEINLLSKIAVPDVGIITNIGTSHIGNLKSRKNICKEKLKIVNGMKDGILIINNDDSYLKKIETLSRIRLYKVGTKENSNLVAYNLKNIKSGVEALVYIDNQKYLIQAISKPFLINKLLVLETSLLFDLNPEDVINEINKFILGHNRLEKFIIDEVTVISDCYNASYESFVNALEIIKKEEKTKILILGDILELGKYSKKFHKKLGKKIRKIKNCKLILVGQNVKYIKQYNITKSIWFNNNEEIKQYLSMLDLKNKIILIKGSHGMHLEEITNYLKEYK